MMFIGYANYILFGVLVYVSGILETSSYPLPSNKIKKSNNINLYVMSMCSVI